jgi:K+/H+ antiporter YhaU regulatory subunit KhtT
MEGRGGGEAQGIADPKKKMVPLVILADRSPDEVCAICSQVMSREEAADLSSITTKLTVSTAHNSFK